ncbi:lipocalin-like domain-containing protein [Xanthobacter oligotrophicus]|uniref:Lipocalin-like domain-containing protein n=1 Tax=Xanthobacter oligotrophicus TaxID=2607286 RepID=A0ABW6ZXX4_9HYPH|nr:lipocalin-like domain-containing protein [Xanthobacter oligotrophicus]MCG5237686.1 lipocalin-like domain-containing protein [Xanthobacter oligotrophicus]
MPDASALLGTWRMVSWTRTVVATGVTTDAMGANPNGYIAYHADGRMMALVVSSQRKKLGAPTPTDPEKVALFDSMLAYAATYEIKGNVVIHHVDATWNPAWGPDLVRPFTLDGDTLVISGAPGRDPVSGEDVVYRMEFRRVAQP